MLKRLTFLCVLLLAASTSIADDGKEPTGVKKPTVEKKPRAPLEAANPVLLMKIKGHGTIEIEMLPKVAPKTVKNFIDLAEGRKAWKDLISGKMVKKPFFDGITFHRVIKGFMLQGGDPKGDGTGGPGYFFEDEINPDALGLHKVSLWADKAKGIPHRYIASTLDRRNPRAHFQKIVIEPLLKKLGITLQEASARSKEWQPKLLALTLKDAYVNMGYKFSKTLPSLPMKQGYLAMANSGPNTNGSQFFINVVDNVYLNGKHTVFAKVIKGFEIVEKISKLPVAAGAKPVTPVVIDFVRLRK